MVATGPGTRGSRLPALPGRVLARAVLAATQGLVVVEQFVDAGEHRHHVLRQVGAAAAAHGLAAAVGVDHRVDLLQRPHHPRGQAADEDHPGEEHGQGHEHHPPGAGAAELLGLAVGPDHGLAVDAHEQPGVVDHGRAGRRLAPPVGFELPDSDAIIYSFGVRYQATDAMQLGAGYLYDHKKSRSVNNGTVHGTFDESAAHLLTVGLAYSF